MSVNDVNALSSYAQAYLDAMNRNDTETEKFLEKKLTTEDREKVAEALSGQKPVDDKKGLAVQPNPANAEQEVTEQQATAEADQQVAGQQTMSAKQKQQIIENLQARIASLMADGGADAHIKEITELSEQINALQTGRQLGGVGVSVYTAPDGHVEGVDLLVPTQDEVDRKNSETKQVILNEFFKEDKAFPVTKEDDGSITVFGIKNIRQGDMTDAQFDEFSKMFQNGKMSDEQFKNLGEYIKDLKTKQEELRKERKNLPGEKKYDTTRNKLKQTSEKDLANQIKALETLQKRQKVLRDEKYADKILKANKANAKTYKQIVDTTKVYTKEEAKAKGKELPKGAKVLSDSDEKILAEMRSTALVELSNAQSDHDMEVSKQEKLYNEGKISKEEKERNVAAANDQLALVIQQYGKQASMRNEDGSWDTRKVQDVLMDYAAGDARFNVDETKKLSNEYDTSSRKINSLVQKYGFDKEFGYSGALKKAGTTFATTLGVSLASFALAKLKDTDTKTATDSKDVQVVKGSETNQYSYTDENGNVHTVTSNNALTENQTITVTATAEAMAKLGATSLLGVSVLPALASGLVTFFQTGAKEENVFNGITPHEALTDKTLSNVNKDCKAVIMAIQGMVITGDTKRDNAIKTAVLDQAIGQGTTSANLRELKAGYDALKLIQKQANQPAEETPAPAEEAPVEETPAPEEEAPVEETPAQEEEEQKTCISHNVVEDGFNIQHKSGMYPYGIAELLGVPKKYQKEFVKMYKDDNGMDKKGQKYNKHPFIRKEYTFADGTSFTLQDTAVTLQEKINKRNWSNNGTGNWHSVKGREVKKTRDGYKYCDDDPYNKAQGIAGRKLTPDEVEAARKEGRLPEDDD